MSQRPSIHFDKYLDFKGYIYLGGLETRDKEEFIIRACKLAQQQNYQKKI